MRDIEDTPPVATPADDLASQRWPHLIVLHGSGVGEVHRVTGHQAVIGRDPDVDIRIEHPTVSRRHARIIVVRDRAFIEDLGSTNGTLVGIHAVRGRRLIPEGAVVALGSVTLLKVTYSPVLNEAVRRSEYQRVTTDLATRVASLEYLRDQLRGECAYARRHGSPLTIVAIRADEIESAADRPSVGSVMGELAVMIYEATRDEDVLARTSRDEFMVLLRADGDQSRTMAERLRARVAGVRLVGGLGSAIRTVTCTVVQLGKTALAAPEEVVDWARLRVRGAAADVKDRVLRLSVLESPAMQRGGPTDAE